MPHSTMKISKDGSRYWTNSKGDYHRLDGPAIEEADGTRKWVQYGRYHRLDGPAIEYSNGDIIWYIRGDFLGFRLIGFWELWNRLDEEERQNVNLHTWLMKLTNS